MLGFGEKKLKEYKEHVFKRLTGLMPILEEIVKGDFSERIKIPEEEDEFTELLVALNSMAESLAELEKIRKKKEEDQVAIIRAEERRRAFAEKLTMGLKEEIKKKTQKIKETEKLRERFISDASHELRTPLTVLQTNLDLLDSLKGPRGQQSKDVEEVIESSRGQIKNLATVLEELSILSRGKRPEELRKEIEMGTVVQEVAKELRALAEAKNINYKVEILEQDLILMGDEGMLRKLVRNLISNAIKYGKEGGRVEILLKKQEGKAELQIKDNGMGISKKDLPYLFERFYRTDKGRSKERGGTGLGLAICKWIIELHGGEIEVESKLRKGSIFKAFLPLKGTWEDKESYWGYKLRKRASK